MWGRGGDCSGQDSIEPVVLLVTSHCIIPSAVTVLIYTKGRPPWYDREGKNLKQPYVIGICGGSASGKTTVARRIIERLEVPWVTVLSMDSFYKVLFHYMYHVLSEGCEGVSDTVCLTSY
uniref:Phosphoribulokinase/uridine kinase domain-containing protein n=1 Tax=Parascaris equorum TaxID=6256 RepID=A0A914S4B4_PAREQ